MIPFFLLSGALEKRAIPDKERAGEEEKETVFQKNAAEYLRRFFRGGRSEEGFVSSLGSFQCFFHIGQQFTDRVLVPCGK